MEKGASVLGDLFRYQQKNINSDSAQSISVLYSLIWSAKQDILVAKSESDLDRIEGQFTLADQFLNEIKVGANVKPAGASLLALLHFRR